jgi:hypothetical protein
MGIDVGDANALAMLDSMRGSTLHVALNFTNEGIDIDSMVKGLNANADILSQPCSNDNLQFVSPNALAVVNIPLDGALFVKAINKLLAEQPAFKKELDAALTSNGQVGMDSKFVMNMISPLLSTIKGDLTLALNGVKPIKNNNALMADVDACAMVNVTNNSIMDFVGEMGIADSPDIAQISKNNYLAKIEGSNCYFGQKGSMLYVSTPHQPIVKNNSAVNASWYSSVNGCYGFVVVSFSSLLSNPDIKQSAQALLKEEFGSAGNGVVKVVNSLDYLLFTVPSPNSAKLRLSLKNKSQNALAQIVNIVKQEM